MADDKLLSDFSFPASPGDYFPPILGDPGEEEAPEGGSLLVPHVIHAFNDNNSSLIATGTTSELTILSTEIPAGQMKEGDVYTLRINAAFFNNTGSPQTIRLRFYFDDVLELDTGPRSINSSAQEYQMWIQIDMAARIRPNVPGSVTISAIALSTATGASDSWTSFGTSESSVGSRSSGNASFTSRIPLDFSAQVGHVDAYFDVGYGWHLLRFPHGGH